MTLFCRICSRPLVPVEEGAPANAYVLAHAICVKVPLIPLRSTSTTGASQ